MSRRSRRKTSPAEDRRALAVLRDMRAIAVAELQRDRAKAAMADAERAIALGTGAEFDMGQHEASLAPLRTLLATYEAGLAEARVAAGIDSTPTRPVCPEIAKHLDAIGLDHI